MDCVFCKTDEKTVNYMMRKDDVSICDQCVLLLAKKLAEQIEKDNEETLSNLTKK